MLADLVRYHLLLSEVATRRDLNDDATITTVAKAVGSIGTLKLLAALTEADSVATGPAAWGTWKADLVNMLVARTAGVLKGGSVGDIVRPAFPSAEQFGLLRAGRSFVRGDGETLLLVTPDKSGVFSRVAGVLALHGLGVLAADAHGEGGWAIEQFRVTTGFAETPTGPRSKRTWNATRRTAGDSRPSGGSGAFVRTASTTGCQPTHGALRRRGFGGRNGARGPRRRLGRPPLPHHAALAELDLDIRRAKVQTLGESVVDAFYLCDADGQKLTDPHVWSEVERAVLHAITSG